MPLSIEPTIPVAATTVNPLSTIKSFQFVLKDCFLRASKSPDEAWKSFPPDIKNMETKMKYSVLNPFALAVMMAVSYPVIAVAQSVHESHLRPHTSAQAMPAVPAVPAVPSAGPHGGTLRQVGSLQFETLVSQAGIQMFVFDHDGRPLSVDAGRGVASLRIEGVAKRYRYDLLPDGKGGLAAPVNLSQIVGRQIEIDFQLVGLPGSGSRPLKLQEVTTIPVGPQQLAAAAIARQKICPVSGQPLGSMGEPVAVDVNGQTVYACCTQCLPAIESDPAKYASGRPTILVSTSTQADAARIAEQATCPVMDEPLGSMGQPVKVMVGDKPIYLCCKGCVKKVQAQPAKYLALVSNGNSPMASGGGSPVVLAEDSPTASTTRGEEARPGVFKVSTADAPFIAAQKLCPVMDEPLDSMGGPYQVDADGKAIYICCPGCAKRIVAEPQKYLSALKAQGVQAPVLR